MTDVARMLERSAVGYAPDGDAGLEATLRLVARRERHRRFGVAVFALALFGAVAVGLGLALTGRQPTSPASSPSSPGQVRPATPAVVPGPAPVAGGISLCAAPTPDGSECVSAASYRIGDPVELRVRGRTALTAGKRVEVWWRTPQGEGWRRFDVVEAQQDGQVTWTWRPASSDHVAQERYAFQVRVTPRWASPVVEARMMGPG